MPFIIITIIAIIITDFTDFTIQFFLTEGEFEGVHTGEDGVSPSRSWHWRSTPDCVGLSKAMSPTASVT